MFWDNVAGVYDVFVNVINRKTHRNADGGRRLHRDGLQTGQGHDLHGHRKESVRPIRSASRRTGALLFPAVSRSPDTA